MAADFRGYLQAKGLGNYLAFTGNDGGVNMNDLAKSLYGESKVLGDYGTYVRQQQSSGNNDANSRMYQTLPSVIKSLYNSNDYKKWLAGQARENTGQVDPAGYGGGASSGPQRDLAAEGFYESGISQTQKLIDTLGAREKNAIGSLTDSFNRGNERRKVSYNDNESDYTKNSDRVVRENARRKSQIDNDVRNNTTAVQRLLASRGAGSSSSRSITAPTAVAAQGTAQRADATQTFDDNKDTLDTNWSRYRREYDQASEDAKADFENQQKDVQSGFAEQGISARQKLQELLTNLASARNGDAGAINRARSVTDEINSLQSKLADYAKRSQARVVASNDPKYAVGETQAMSNEGIDASQRAQDPTYDETQSYYGDVKALSDDELLKQLYGDPNYQ